MSGNAVYNMRPQLRLIIRRQVVLKINQPVFKITDQRMQRRETYPVWKRLKTPLLGRFAVFLMLSPQGGFLIHKKEKKKPVNQAVVQTSSQRGNLSSRLPHQPQAANCFSFFKKTSCRPSLRLRPVFKRNLEASPGVLQRVNEFVQIALEGFHYKQLLWDYNMIYTSFEYARPRRADAKRIFIFFPFFFFCQSY